MRRYLINRISIIAIIGIAVVTEGCTQAPPKGTLREDDPIGDVQGIQTLVAHARQEPELDFQTGAGTFGDEQGLNELANAFNKAFGLKAKIRFSAGPSMPQMAARIIIELKSRRTPSTDIFLGTAPAIAMLDREKALERVQWAETFPWITHEMELVPEETLLVFTSPEGILYNSNLIPSEKAPHSYEDLVNPTLDTLWAGKMATFVNNGWLVNLSWIWGRERTKDFARKLAANSSGRILQNGEAAERLASGEFALVANSASVLETMWAAQARGIPLVGVIGSKPAVVTYPQLGVLQNARHPNLARLFVAFIVTPEAQTILDKYTFRSSHLVKGTRMANYLAQHMIEIQDGRKVMDHYLHGDGLELDAEMSAIMNRK